MAVKTKSPKGYTVSRDQLKFEQGALGRRFASGSCGQTQAAVSVAEANVCKPIVNVEVIIFGKIHLVDSDDYKNQAAHFHEMLGQEARLLIDSISSSRQIYHEWEDPDGWVDGTVATSVRWFSTLRQKRRPDPARFDLLSKDCDATLQKIISDDLSYEVIREIGISLSHVRANLADLNRDIDRYRGVAIDNAETMTKGLETIESTSFQALNLVPTLMMMDPFREAAYKIGLVVTRTAARGLGAWLAETNVISELYGVLKQDVPPLIVDLVTGCLNKLPAIGKPAAIQKEILIFVVQQQIEFLSDFTLLLIEKKGEITSDDLLPLAENRLISCIAKVLSLMFGGNPSDSAKQKWAKSLIESTCNTIIRDFNTAMRDAKHSEPPKSAWEVFVKELPWTIVKVVQGTLIGGMQRQASTGAEVGRETGVANSKTGFSRTDDGKEFLRAQSASSIFTGKYVGVKSTRPPRAALPPMKLQEYIAWSNALNIHPDMAGQMRRYTHDEQLLVAFRMPNKKMMDLMAEKGMWPKPLAVKAKSANVKGSATEGLVTRPTKEPLTHSNYDDAKAQWDKEISKMQKQGMLVRADGVLFHPDMLVSVASPSDQALAQRAHDLLGQTRQNGWEMDSEVNKAFLDQHPAERDYINQARVGYLSDLDVSEVVDAQTGDRRVLGGGADPKESGLHEINIARINQDNLDRGVNINHDNQNRPGQKAMPNPLHLIQHGGDWEYVGGAVGGEVGVIGPDGYFTVLKSRLSQGTTEDHNKDIRNQWEDLLRDRFKSNYKSGSLRGMQIPKPAWIGTDHWTTPNGKGKIIRTDRTERWTHYYENQTQDLQGNGTPMGLHDVIASMMHRGLIFIWPDDPQAESETGGTNQIVAAERQHQVLISQDTKGFNMVVAAQANDSIGGALVRLSRAARDLTLINSVGVNVWYEIYTSFRPVTSDFILSRIGGRISGIGPDGADVKDQLSSQLVCGDAHYAFCIEGFAAAYTPDLSEHKKGLDRIGFDKRTVDSAVGYPQVRGLKLMDVWESPTTQSLRTAPTQIGGRPVVVFTSPLASCPASADLRRTDARLIPMV